MAARIARAPLAGLVAASALGCGSFQDPNVVVDLRVIAMAASPPSQIVDIDLGQPPDPGALLAQLVPTQVCALVADPGAQRRLLWSLTLCPLNSDERCSGELEVALASGLADDPETAVPEPALCASVAPDGNLLAIASDFLRGDTLRGLGGVDYAVQLRVGGENGDRELDQYATKTVHIAPRVPPTATANANPRIDRIDTAIDDAALGALTLGRCTEIPAPLQVRAGSKLRMTPIEPDGVRETYVVPTLDGKSQTFTESLTYQWIASNGGFSKGSTGGPRDLSGNPAPLFTDYRAPAAGDLTGPTDVSLWIVQRDERLGVHWYEACLRVVP
jgi:hypothetical protein